MKAKTIFYAESLSDLEYLYEKNQDSVLLSFKTLNRFTQNTLNEFIELCKKAKSFQLEVILEWDILILENNFDNAAKIFKSLDISLYDKIRVQDLGVLEFVLEFTDKPIQFIAETSFANLHGLKYLENYIGERCDLLVLSNQLSKEKILSFKKNLKTKIEVLGLAPILLFYSPRFLLNPLTEIKKDELEALAESEESPHKNFPVKQNMHGTFMFHTSDLCIIDDLELRDLDIQLRIDLRSKNNNLIKNGVFNFLEMKIDFSCFKKIYPVRLIRGYYNINKSDVLFKKLKNNRLTRMDEEYLGEVIESIKDKYICLKVKSEKKISIGNELYFVTPEGKKIKTKVSSLSNLNLEKITSSSMGQLVLINYKKGVWNRSQAYFQ